MSTGQIWRTKFVEDYIRSLEFSSDVSDNSRTLVAGNIRAFYAAVLTAAKTLLEAATDQGRQERKTENTQLRRRAELAEAKCAETLRAISDFDGWWVKGNWDDQRIPVYNLLKLLHNNPGQPLLDELDLRGKEIVRLRTQLKHYDSVVCIDTPVVIRCPDENAEVPNISPVRVSRVLDERDKLRERCKRLEQVFDQHCDRHGSCNFGCLECRDKALSHLRAAAIPAKETI